MKSLNNKGVTLLEVVISPVLFLGAILLLAVCFQLVTTKAANSQAAMERESTLDTLARAVMRHGRLAYDNPAHNFGCAVLINGVECFVDFNVPPTGTPVRTRFVHDVDEKVVAYEHYNTLTTLWEAKLTFPDIEEFIVCEGTQISSGICTDMPVQNDYRSLVGQLPAGRFYRFRARTVASVDRGILSKSITSSFFVRNPTSDPNLFYQWSGSVNVN